MKTVCFICTGNTCRSPMAEGLFRLYLQKKNLDFITVKSAGLAAACGMPPSDNAVTAAKELGADISAHRSKALTPYDFTKDTYFVCMTAEHEAVLRQYVPRERILVLNVPDPFMGDEHIYRLCAESIQEKLPSIFRFVFGIDTIKPMQAEDIKGIASLENACFSHPWTTDNLTEELDNSSARFFVAVKDGTAVGYIGANNIAGEVYITNVAVLLKNRKQGIGALLLQVLLTLSEKEKASFVTLEVRESNVPAIALYEKYGFQPVGKRKDFYRDPQEDARIYTKYFTE